MIKNWEKRVLKIMYSCSIIHIPRKPEIRIKLLFYLRLATEFYWRSLKTFAFITNSNIFNWAIGSIWIQKEISFMFSLQNCSPRQLSQQF